MSQRDEVTILMRQCGILRKALTEISNARAAGDVELLKSLAVSGLVEADVVRLRLDETQCLASAKPHRCFQSITASLGHPSGRTDPHEVTFR